MTVAYIEWIDSGVAATGWAPLDDVHQEAHDMAVTPIRSAGLVLSQDDNGVTLALSVNDHAEEACLAMFIPCALIRTMAIWEPEDKS